MSLIDFANLGVGIFAIAVLAYLVDKFLKFMERQGENFRDTINNHLKENSSANRDLALTIKELLDYLKHTNSTKRN